MVGAGGADRGRGYTGLRGGSAGAKEGEEARSAARIYCSCCRAPQIRSIRRTKYLLRSRRASCISSIVCGGSRTVPSADICKQYYFPTHSQWPSSSSTPEGRRCSRSVTGRRTPSIHLAKGRVLIGSEKVRKSHLQIAIERSNRRACARGSFCRDSLIIAVLNGIEFRAPILYFLWHYVEL